MQQITVTNKRAVLMNILILTHKSTIQLHNVKIKLHEKTCYQMLKYEISNKIFQLSFNRLNDFFQVILSRKPTFCTETLQSLQRLSPGFHCLVTFLTFLTF